VAYRTSIRPAINPHFVPQLSSFEDVRQVLGQLANNLQQQWSGVWPPTAFGGSRLTGVGSPQGQDDAVTLGYLHSVLVPQVLGASSSNTSITFPTGVSVGPYGIFSLATSGSMTPNLTSGWVQQSKYMVASCTLAPPVVSVPGATFYIQLMQDGTGGRQVTFNSYYHGMSMFELDTTANTMAGLLFQVDTGGGFAQLLDIPMNGWAIA
jgi:hypothetical protein